MGSLKWIFIIYLALFQDSFLVSGQEVDNISLGKKMLRISIWRPSHGLPTWKIRDMVKDQRGLLWLATDMGLVSFDGKKFCTLSLNTPGAQAKDLSKIIIDHRQNIWLFFRSEDSLAIRIYDPFIDRTYTSREYAGREMHFSNSLLPSICTVHDTIWLLDPERRKGGFIDLNGLWNKVFNDLEPHAATLVYFPAGNRLFWSFETGQMEIRLKDASGRTLETYSCLNTPIYNGRISSRGDFLLTPIRHDQDGSLIGVFRCVRGKGLTALTKAEKYQLAWGSNMIVLSPLLLRANNSQGIEINQSVTGCELYDQGNILYKGLDNYLMKNHRMVLERVLFQPEEQAFWMIAPGALIRLEILPNQFTSYLNGIPILPSTRGLQVLGKSLYINSYQGHFEVDLQKKIWKPLSILNKYAFGLALTCHDGLLWSGYHGPLLSIYNPVNGKAKFIPIKVGIDYFEVLSFFFFNQHTTYLGSTSGLIKYHSDSGVFEPCGLSGQEVYCFHSNNSGLWVGTSKGLMWQAPSNGLTDQSFHPIFPLLIQSTIKHIYEDRDGVFWMATKDGLLRWRPFSSVLETFNIENSGFPSNQITAVYEDDLERLWLPSENGIICFAKKSRNFETFTVFNGLNSNERNGLSHCRDSTGRLYFGSIAGVISFHPDSIAQSQKPLLSLQWRSLLLKNRSQDQNKNLTAQAIFSNAPIIVPASTQNIILDFFAPEYSGASIQYRWRIPQLSKDWSALADPHIELMNLQYGDYTIEIEATIMGNSAHKARLQLALSVEVPFYLSMGFLLFLFFSLSLIAVVIFKWRQKRLQDLNFRLEKEVAKQTIQLEQEKKIILQQSEMLKQLDEKKTRFFQDISHEISNPLSLILGHVSDLINRQNHPEIYQKKLESIQRNARKIIHLTTETIELTKLDTVIRLNRKAFLLGPIISKLFQDFELTATQKGVNLEFSQNIPENPLLTDGLKLEKILFNLIHNAINYTSEGAHVHIIFYYNAESELLVQVQDTGIGIPSEHLEYIFDRFYQVPYSSISGKDRGFGIGLALCQSYAKLMGGHITAASTLGVGTTMRLLIPCPMEIPTESEN